MSDQKYHIDRYTLFIQQDRYILITLSNGEQITIETEDSDTARQAVSHFELLQSMIETDKQLSMYVPTDCILTN